MFFKFTIKKYIYYFLANFFFGTPKNSRGSILCYHRVSGYKNNYFDPNYPLITSVKNFRKQILKIKSKYKIVSLDEFIHHINSNSDEYLVVITFDDGYSDNYDDLLPIVNELQIPVTIFVTTSFLSSEPFIWWYELWSFIKKNEKIIFNGKENSIKSKKQKIKFFNYISYKIINKKNNQNVNNLIDHIKNVEVCRLSKSISLKIDQLKLLKQNPYISIGSHSVTHANLSLLNNLELKKELIQSKKKLEEIIEDKIDNFAFPFGTNNEITEREITETKKIGYQCSVTTLNEIIKKNTNLFSLPRIGIDNSFNDKNILGVFSKFNYKLKNIYNHIK